MAHPYLTTRKTTRQLYFRRAVPSDLRAILPREIWISLATPCRRTALTRLARAAVWLKKRWNRRDASSGASSRVAGHPARKADYVSPAARRPCFTHGPTQSDGLTLIWPHGRHASTRWRPR